MSSISSVPPISSVSSTGNTAQLEKQKADLEKQIATEKSSKDDPKTQALKIASLQAQVAQIDAEISAQSKSASKPEHAHPDHATDSKKNSKQPNPDPGKFLDTTI